MSSEAPPRDQDASEAEGGDAEDDEEAANSEGNGEGGAGGVSEGVWATPAALGGAQFRAESTSAATQYVGRRHVGPLPDRFATNRCPKGVVTECSLASSMRALA